MIIIFPIDLWVIDLFLILTYKYASHLFANFVRSSMKSIVLCSETKWWQTIIRQRMGDFRGLLVFIVKEIWNYWNKTIVIKFSYKRGAPILNYLPSSRQDASNIHVLRGKNVNCSFVCSFFGNNCHFLFIVCGKKIQTKWEA